MSPIANTSGRPGSVQSGFTLMRPAWSMFAPLASRAWRPAAKPGRPPPRGSFSRGSGTVASARPRLHAFAVDARDVGVRANLDSHPREVAVGDALEAFGEGAEHLRAGVEQHDPRLWTGPSCTPRTTGGGKLGDLPASSTPVGAGADDHEGQPLVSLALWGLRPRSRTRPSIAGAQELGVGERLQSRREPRPLVVAEVGVSGAPGDDQEVVGSINAAVGRSGVDGTRPRGQSR